MGPTNTYHETPHEAVARAFSEIEAEKRASFKKQGSVLGSTDNGRVPAEWNQLNKPDLTTKLADWYAEQPQHREDLCKATCAQQTELPMELPTPRKALLDEALAIVSKDRNAAYGNPEDNFANIAAYWNSYLTQRSGHATISVQLNGQDIAHMMILMKMARLATNPAHYDSLLDIAGYAACGNDCRVRHMQDRGQ